jgi:peptidoglycan/LPS O-acetylase OafA/YrhL
MVPLNTTQVHSSYLGTRTFGSLDGVRGLCILAVVWHHATPAVPGAFFERGFLGVDMFFVLSGFLIVTLLLRERDRMGTINLKKFYARRMLRIFPIYYLLLFGLLLLYLVTKPASVTAREFYRALPFLLTYTSNWVQIQANNVGIMWSLATEEQFYVCWPMIEKFLRPLGIAVVLAVVLFVNQLINFGALDGVFSAIYGKQPGLLILDTTFTPIALGVLLAHVLNTRRTFMASYRLLGHGASSLIFGAVLVALIVFAPADISGLPRLLIQLVMTLVLGALVVREDHWARPVLIFPPLAYVGMISYGMYIYHLVVIHPVRIGFERLGGNLASFSFFVAALIACTAVAGLSYRFIEQPLLKLKARFASDGDSAASGHRATSPIAETVGR